MRGKNEQESIAPQAFETGGLSPMHGRQRKQAGCSPI
jgi:hypothetical protein